MNKANLRNIKEEIKSNYRIIYKKPKYLMTIPILIIISLHNRIKYKKNTIYLTETNINERFIKTCDINNLKIVGNISSFINLAYSRATEDSTISFKQYIKTAEERFLRGDCCFILINTEGNPVSYMFASYKVIDIPEVKLHLKLLNAEVSIFDVYTFLFERRKGYHQQLFNKVYCYLGKNKIETVYLWLMKHNKASIKAHMKVGFKRVLCEYNFYKFFGIGIRTSKKNIKTLSELLDT